MCYDIIQQAESWENLISSAIEREEVTTSNLLDLGKLTKKRYRWGNQFIIQFSEAQNVSQILVNTFNLFNQIFPLKRIQLFCSPLIKCISLLLCSGRRSLHQFENPEEEASSLIYIYTPVYVANFTGYEQIYFFWVSHSYVFKQKGWFQPLKYFRQTK